MTQRAATIFALLAMKGIEGIAFYDPDETTQAAVDELVDADLAVRNDDGRVRITLTGAVVALGIAGR